MKYEIYWDVDAKNLEVLLQVRGDGNIDNQDKISLLYIFLNRSFEQEHSTFSLGNSDCLYKGKRKNLHSFLVKCKNLNLKKRKSRDNILNFKKTYNIPYEKDSQSEEDIPEVEIFDEDVSEYQDNPRLEDINPHEIDFDNLESGRLG